jgi:hypothetical protein
MAGGYILRGPSAVVAHCRHTVRHVGAHPKDAAIRELAADGESADGAN